MGDNSYHNTILNIQNKLVEEWSRNFDFPFTNYQVDNFYFNYITRLLEDPLERILCFLCKLKYEPYMLTKSRIMIYIVIHCKMTVYILAHINISSYVELYRINQGSMVIIDDQLRVSIPSPAFRIKPMETTRKRSLFIH